jgi:hypothetical protein
MLLLAKRDQPVTWSSPSPPTSLPPPLIYYAVLDNPIKGLNGVNLHMLFTHILTTYAQISQPNL